jgi:hypothetical protein
MLPQNGKINWPKHNGTDTLSHTSNISLMNS